MTTSISTRAVNVIGFHPDDDEIYGLDFSDRLPSGVLIESATIAADTDGLTLGSATPNAATFTNHKGRTVAIGKGVQWQMSGGADGVDYTLTVVAACDDNQTRALDCVAKCRGTAAS